MNQEMKEYLAELEQLANEATQEPWVVYCGEEYGREICHRIHNVVIKGHGKCYSGNPKDCKFIVAAREAVPKLINKIRELDKELEKCSLMLEEKVNKEIKDAEISVGVNYG